MGTDYPEHLLAREAAPPYQGEAPFALWHFSEDPTLETFRPRAPAGEPHAAPLVRAVDTRHAPLLWFPGNCPRVCMWPVSTTTDEDRERFFGQSGAHRVHVMESSWLWRMRGWRLYAYRLPAETFRPDDEAAGYWVSDRRVDAVQRVVVDDLIGRHAVAGIELRITPSLWPLWERVTASTVEFSGSRVAWPGPGPQEG